MKAPAVALLFAALSFLMPFAATADDDQNMTPAEREVVGLFRPMARVAQPTGMAIRVVVERSAAHGPSPAYMVYKDGVCSLNLALRDNANYQAVFTTRGNYSRKAKLHAMLAHELGHCFTRYLEERDAKVHGHSLASLTKEEQRDDEVRADLFALAWAAVYNPEEFDEVYDYLWELRFELSEDEGHFYANKAELAQGRNFKPIFGSANPNLLTSVATTPSTLP